MNRSNQPKASRGRAKPIEKVDDSISLQGYFRALFVLSKRRWGFGILSTMFALFPVPLASLLMPDIAQWWAVAMAGAFAVVGKLLDWWSHILGGEADDIRRMSEYQRGLGVTVDRKIIADKRAKYKSVDRMAEKRRIVGYYDDRRKIRPREGSSSIMVRIFMESSWWTERLACRTGVWLLRMIIVVVMASCGLIVYSWSAYTEVDDGVVGLVVCLILTMDLIVLQRSYVSLERSSADTFDKLRGLVSRCDSEVDSAKRSAMAIQGYLIARSNGPPIPEKVYTWYRSRLKELWENELADE